MGDADRAALAAVSRGEVAGLGELADRHGPALLAFMTGLLGDRPLAEEVVQDTLVAVWRGASGFVGGSTVRTWMFGIARRRASEVLRRRGLARVAEPDDALGGLVEPSAGPEHLTLVRAELDHVAAAIRALRPAHREVVVLACVHEMTGPEIAAVLGIPLGTVKSRLNHARAALAAALSDDDRGGDTHGR